VDAERPTPRSTRTGTGPSWRARPDWWPDPPDASELEERDAAAEPAKDAAPPGDRPADAAAGDHTEASAERTRREASAERTRREPPTLPELPNQWAQLPPTVPSVPTPPHGIRRSTILLIILWLAILALYLWVRPLG
jgi:hypothetical protein